MFPNFFSCAFEKVFALAFWEVGSQQVPIIQQIPVRFVLFWKGKMNINTYLLFINNYLLVLHIQLY